MQHNLYEVVSKAGLPVCLTDTSYRGYKSPKIMAEQLEGILVESDEPTIQYIMWLNESARGQPHQQAVIEQIDKHSVLIKKDKVEFVKQQLRRRDMEHTYDPEEEEEDT